MPLNELVPGKTYRFHIQDCCIEMIFRAAFISLDDGDVLVFINGEEVTLRITGPAITVEEL